MYTFESSAWLSVCDSYPSFLFCLCKASGSVITTRGGKYSVSLTLNKAWTGSLGHCCCCCCFAHPCCANRWSILMLFCLSASFIGTLLGCADAVFIIRCMSDADGAKLSKYRSWNHRAYMTRDVWLVWHRFSARCFFLAPHGRHNRLFGLLIQTLICQFNHTHTHSGMCFYRSTDGVNLH